MRRQPRRPVDLGEGPAVYACVCHAVPAADVAACIEAGAHDEHAVGQATGAGTGCGGCLERICELIRAKAPEHDALQRVG